jgi:hypothetical protein
VPLSSSKPAGAGQSSPLCFKEARQPGCEHASPLPWPFHRHFTYPYLPGCLLVWPVITYNRRRAALLTRHFFLPHHRLLLGYSCCCCCCLYLRLSASPTPAIDVNERHNHSVIHPPLHTTASLAATSRHHAPLCQHLEPQLPGLGARGDDADLHQDRLRRHQSVASPHHMSAAC